MCKEKLVSEVSVSFLVLLFLSLLLCHPVVFVCNSCLSGFSHCITTTFLYSALCNGLLCPSSWFLKNGYIF